jgi:hypothetical protein
MSAIPHFSDQKLLIAMFKSVTDVRHIVCRSLEIIEQSRIMLYELDTQKPRADESRKYEGSARWRSGSST